MLKQFANRHNLVLKSGQNLQILFTLALNYLLMRKLRLYKRIKGIKHPIVHYYAVCWNEERMLPFMFDYYDQFVDHYTIYDNYSTDSSERIIRLHKNAEIVRFETEGFNDDAHNKIKNSCWKRSRGRADYVIVCDVDEFLYHPNMESFLMDCIMKGFSYFTPLGYNMISEKFPEKGEKLMSQVQKGVCDSNYAKHIIFDPHRIVDINYQPGAHKAEPTGIVREASSQNLKLCHYKNLSLAYVLGRVASYRDRQSEVNIRNNYAVHYQFSNEKISDDFYQMLHDSKAVL